MLTLFSRFYDVARELWHAHRIADNASIVYASMPPPPFPGTIPPELGGLTALTELDLRDNQLTGER